MLNSIKYFFSSIIFLLLGTGFFVLIGFEINYGVSGGKFGGAEVINMPGTFLFFIWIQALWGLSLITDAVKEFWTLLHKPVESNLQNNNPPPAKIIAIYWLLATTLIVILNLLAIWSAFEMIFNMFKLLTHYKMPAKAIFSGLFLISFFVFCYLYYMFIFRSLIDTFFPKSRISFQIFRKK